MDLERQLREDRSLRDAAERLVLADYTHLRGELQRKGIGERIIDRIGEGATGVFEEAVEVADNNRGVLATLLAAIALWFARNPILSLFFDDEDDDDENGWGEDDRLAEQG